MESWSEDRECEIGSLNLILSEGELMTVFDQGSGFTRWKNNPIHCQRSVHQRARHCVAVLHTPVLHASHRLNHFTLKPKVEIDFVNYVHLTHEEWRILGAPPNNIAREGGARI